MSGSEGGSGKRTGGNAGTAPRPDPASQASRDHALSGSGRRTARTQVQAILHRNLIPRCPAAPSSATRR